MIKNLIGKRQFQFFNANSAQTLILSILNDFIRKSTSVSIKFIPFFITILTFLSFYFCFDPTGITGFTLRLFP
ncbi:hypothetical protein BpHYR1_041045 [Brachionus plicatilis]|uniref:Uncharacterized protein n=1 Tax=Brachionus plicatilis TaxID=10195 RepID=A0A3M7P4G9_BRAPC|nr:hypothetical protein BpHYR1_041045 [Brachionus plicatilis]